MALTRSGERQEGQGMMQKFQVLRTKGYATTIGQNYLEQGRYSEAIASTGAEQGLIDPAKPDVIFTDATSSTLPKAPDTGPTSINEEPEWSILKAKGLTEDQKRQIVAASGGVVPFDFDVDGDLDLLEVGVQSIRLYRNDVGKLIDVTEQSGLRRSTSPVPITAVAGDYDNDGRRTSSSWVTAAALYHNDANGKFTDVTTASAIPDYPYIALSAALARCRSRWRSGHLHCGFR
jgi:hypothetical protein